MKRVLVFIILLLTTTLTFALGADIERLTNSDGLSNSSVNTIFQDSSDLMWFGTWDGLNLYNGHDFSVFKPLHNNGNTISNNIIRGIVEDCRGNIWISTDRGINKYDPSHKLFTHYFTDFIASVAVRENSFHVLKTNDGNIYAAIYGKGLYEYDLRQETFIPIESVENKEFVKVLSDQYNRIWYHTADNKLKLLDSDLTINNVSSAFSGKKQFCLLTTNGNIILYDIENNIETDSFNLPSSIGKINNISHIDNGLLIGSSTGLYRLNINTRDLEHVIADVNVLSIFYGTQNIIWVGTDNQGVWKITGRNQSFTKFPESASDQFGNSAVRSFYEDTNGDLWVGTKGHGIYILEKQGNERVIKKRFSRLNGLSNDSVFTIADGGDVIWIGTDGEGICYFDRKSSTLKRLKIDKSLGLRSVYHIYPQNDTLWVGTSGQGMYMLAIDKSTRPYSVSSYTQYKYNNNSTSLSSDVVYSIIPDSEKKLWVGTRGGGIERFDISSGTFESFRFSGSNATRVSADDILSLLKDNSGNLWVGTSMGLYKLSLESGNISMLIHYGEKDGLPNNTIHGILEDANGSKWVSTNCGIAKITEQDKTVKIVSWFKNDGLQDNEFSDGAFYKSNTTGEMFFGGIRGFNSFMPLMVEPSPYMPNLVLDEFLIDNEEAIISDFINEVKGEKTLILGHKSNSMTFRYIPIDYLDADKCEMSYCLEGFNRDWIKLGTSNAIVLSNLKPGKYTLKVKCSSADKKWSDDCHVMPIRIKSPWYATTIAKFLYIILLLTITYVIYRIYKYRYEIKKEIQEQKREQRKMEEQTEAKLVFFTNIAHEFSNLLTLIYGPCEVLLKDRSISSKNMKYLNIIESNSNRMYNLIQQLIFFRKAETGHLSLKIESVDICELARFESDYFLDRFEQQKISFSIESQSNQIMWPTDRDSIEKIMFNLISNAAKYTPNGGNIIVSVNTNNDKLTLAVTNTGIGIPKEKLEAIFDRFEVLNRFEEGLSKGKISNGIGLSLCKSLVTLLDGRIWVESDGIAYTSFILELPRKEMDITEKQPDYQEATHTKDNTPIVEENTIVPELSEDGIKGAILLVDDNVEMRKFLRSILSSEYRINEASDGHSAIEAISKITPDLIITDMMMPGMNGAEFVKEVKSREVSRHIPIIMMSAKNTIDDQILGLESGADAYMVKPFNPRYLLVMIENLLGRNKAIMEYSNSAWQAVEQYNDKIVKKEDKELITSVTDFINRNIGSDTLSIDMIAQEVAVSKMYLYRKLKELLDMTPTEYIRHLRLEKSENLLKTTNKTVQEIMFECGFNSKTYFYREFAKKYHLTPKEYNKANKKI